MNKLFIFVFLIGLYSCGMDAQSKQETSSERQSVLQEASKESALTAKPAKRSESQIKKTFPYDIPVQDKNQKLYTSDQVIEKGKPTVLLFWLTTCVPCGLEMDAIQKKYAGWKKEADFNFVAISTDFPDRFPAFVNRVEKRNFPWDSYHDLNREFRKVMPGELNGLPQTFLLDKDGNIAYHKKRYASGDEDVLFAKIKELAL